MASMVEIFGYDLASIGLRLPSSSSNSPEDPKKMLILRAEKTGKGTPPFCSIPQSD